MYPILFHIGPIAIYSYALMIVIGVFLSYHLYLSLILKEGVTREDAFDITFWTVPVALLGTKLADILSKPAFYLSNPISMLQFWQGLTFVGAPFFGLFFVIGYTRKYKLPFWKLIDAGAPALALGHFFGRIGCFLAGCCWGKPTGSDWFGVRFDNSFVDHGNYAGVLLHPTQLYEAVSLLFICLGLIWVYHHKKFDGQVVLTYFIVYPIVRSVIEVFRGDKIRGFVIDDWVSTSQFYSIIFVGGALITLYVKLNSLKKETRRKNR